MENLTQWIVYGVLIAVSYMFIGYHIAQLSREVRKTHDFNLNVVNTLPLKIFLYPLSIADTMNNRGPFWFLHEYKYSNSFYVIWHLFLWPFRIVVNLILIAALFVLIPMIAFLAAVVIRMIAGAIEAVAGKIKSAETDS